jgi:hypothetical protein
VVGLVLVLLAVGSVACGTDRRVRPGFAGTDAGPADVDGGRPMLDAGPSFDAGVLPMRDAGPGLRDSGVPPRDSGPPPMRDSGTPPPTDAGPTSATVGDVQRGLIASGTVVFIRGLVVTATYPSGVWAQDPVGGTTYSGVRIFLRTAPTLSVGDRIDVEGVVGEYFAETEIAATSVVDLGPTTPIAPARVTVAQAVSEPYEGVLVELTDVVSSMSSYDCSFDNPSCTDTALWQVSSTSSSIVVFAYAYEDIDWSSRVGAHFVTGVLSWRFDSRRIMPRRSADLT